MVKSNNLQKGNRVMEAAKKELLDWLDKVLAILEENDAAILRIKTADA